MTTREIDHAEYPRRCRRMTDAELAYTISDCRESLTAWPDSPNAGRYQDEISYAAAELARRDRAGRRSRMPRARVF
jgi:hypothetical protein